MCKRKQHVGDKYSGTDMLAMVLVNFKSLGSIMRAVKDFDN